MSPQRPQPRRSALSGIHPARPTTSSVEVKPEIPAFTAQEPGPAPVEPSTSRAPRDEVVRSQKVTFNLPVELVEEAKNAFWLERQSYRSWSAWVSEALQVKIDQVKSAAGVEAIPARPTPGGLPPGRPLQ